MNLVKLNSLAEDDFADFFKHLLEHADWVIKSLELARPFSCIYDLKINLSSIICSASDDQKRSLLIHHPKLGSSVQVQGFSESEQNKAGLHALSDDESVSFKKMNEIYEGKMGFPFVVAVAGLSQREIFQALELRCHSNPINELAVAIDELIKIAFIRISKLISD
ncbi:MAG: 2-oxo-4-hydroxy-4-carboxy-5-ureidoimidazoline decarboxylase [Halothiobacillus sp.]